MLLDEITRQQLIWYGYVERMNPTGLSKIIINWKPEGRQTRGRPRRTWKDGMYVGWEKSSETDFLLTMNFILFTNQGYPLQNSSFGQLHSDGGVVSIVRNSAGMLLLGIPFSLSVTLFWILSKVPKWRPFKWFLRWGE